MDAHEKTTSMRYDQCRKIVVCARDSREVLMPDSRFTSLVLQGPAGMGDVWGLIRHDVAVIVLVDCIQHGGASVWHREILDALDHGITIIGAGGVGALKAVELDGSGMLGVGWVYSQYLHGGIEKDDEVCASADGLSLVDIRYTLDMLVRNGNISIQQHYTILSRMQGVHYTRRTLKKWQAILEELQIELPADSARPLDVKHVDAQIALNMAMDCLRQQETGDTFAGRLPDRKWQWLRTSSMYQSYVFPEGVVRGYHFAESLGRQLGMLHFHTLSEKFFILQWLKEHSLLCPRSYVDLFLRSRAHMFQNDRYLLANGLTASELTGLLTETATVQWARENKRQIFQQHLGQQTDSYAHAWALEHGVTSPEHNETGAWVIAQGPEYFGFNWDYDAALLKQLQLDGKMAQYARQQLDSMPQKLDGSIHV
ncbi:TfuA-like protein [Desulfogranum japonicum]|uniref:TfuA-like protein n=1 Tax=Desulfogranum japonicum TaxID=231447 RepID=UPI000688E4FB|nr:TfuA-like protein [Desulfogranum japonicum]